MHLAFLVAALALQAPPRTPTQVAQLAFDAIAKRQWQALSALVDSTRLEKFRRQYLGLLVEWAQRRDEIAASAHGFGLSGIDSLTPQVISVVKDVPVPTFGRTQTIGSIAALPAREFFAQWLAAADRSIYDPLRTWSDLKRELVGEVRIDDTLAYVIYRREMRSVVNTVMYVNLPGQPEVLPLKRVSGRWVLLLNDDVGGGDLLFHVLPIRREPQGDYSKVRREARLNPAPPLPPGASSPRRTPAQAAAAAFDAFRRADWEALAGLVHPMMLSRFQREQIETLLGWAEEKESGSDAAFDGIQIVMPSGEDSLPAAAVGRVAAVRVPLFRDSATVGQLAAATPREFFVLWCQAVYGHPAETDTGWASYNSPRRILGSVLEGASLAHVLYVGGPFEYDNAWEVTRMPLMRTQDDWALLLNDDIGERSLLGMRLMMLDHPEEMSEPPQ